MKTFSDTDKDFICDITMPCFTELTPEETLLVRESRVQVLFRRGENITKQGAFASYVIFIVNGFSRQYIECSNGRDYNLRIVRPGEMVGLSAVFNPNTFSYSVVALTETTGFLIEKDAIAGLVKNNGAFAFAIIRRYCEHNTRLYSSLDHLLHQQTNGRMASVLLTLAPENFGGEDLFRQLSRRELADFAGISTEGTVKVLKSFEKDKIISLSDKTITLLDHRRLQEISRIG
ncbi:MAG: Crp/Fnr family transcriptional regulator [Bacteroidales bacterium]|jgi:CRP/FNR family transcriptional regulator|nr:Crp/Fnr family transcriptional regulator [Bacteroidales bacterium]